MKKSLLLSLMSLVLLLGSNPAAAAVAKSSALFWIGEIKANGGIGVNATTVNGKNSTSKQLYKGAASSLAVTEDWVYFLKQDPDSEVVAGNIVRMKKDGTKLTEITKGNKVYSRFFIDGKKIYYSAFDDDYNVQLRSMNLDGTGSKIVKGKLDHWSYIVTNGSFIYVNTGGDSRLYRSKLDGSGKGAISAKEVDPYDGYKLYDGVLYYSERDTAGKGYLIDINGKNKAAISSKAVIRPVGYLNQWFYYEEVAIDKNGSTTARSLIKVKRDGSQKKTVSKFGTADQYLGQLNGSLVYLTAAGKAYTVK